MNIWHHYIINLWIWKKIQNAFEESDKKGINFVYCKLSSWWFVVQLKKSSLSNLINNLCENCVLLCFEISIPFGCCCHVFYQDHNTLASIVCFKKLFILYFEIIAKNKNILVKFTFSIYNQ